MNEKIKKLIEISDCTIDGMGYGEGNIEYLIELIVQECCDIITKEGNEWLEFGKNPPQGQENHAAAAIFTAFRLKEDTVAILKKHFGVKQ